MGRKDITYSCHTQELRWELKKAQIVLSRVQVQVKSGRQDSQLEKQAGETTFHPATFYS